MALLFSLAAPGAFCRAQDLLDAPGPGYPHELIGEPGRGLRRAPIPPESAPAIITEKPAADPVVPPFRFELKPPSNALPVNPSIRPEPAPAKPLNLSPEAGAEKVPPEWTLRSFGGVPYYIIPLTH